MKRSGNLYDKILDMGNLRLAFWKAQRSKADRTEVIKFRRSLNRNLRSLQRELVHEDVVVGSFHRFYIRDPKLRLICAASFRERVLHHAIMNVCHDSFERFQVFDSYASRRGKGTVAAIERARKFTQTGGYFLKMDVRKYFDSIRHEMVRRLLERRFKDQRLLNLFGRIIDSYKTQPGRGLPIDSLISQYLANHVLAVLDHRVKEIWRVRRYVRYMDDMIVWSGDRRRLRAIYRKTRQFLDNQLGLELKPANINRTDRGVPFLGYVAFPDKITLSKQSRNRYRRKLSTACYQLRRGSWTQEMFAQRVTSLIAFTNHTSKPIEIWRKENQGIGQQEWLEPRLSRRQLEQQSRQLSIGESQQERTGQPEQQLGLSRCSPSSSEEPTDVEL